MWHSEELLQRIREETGGPQKLAVLAANAVETQNLLFEHEKMKKVGEFFKEGTVFVDTVSTRMIDQEIVVSGTDAHSFIKHNEVIVIETFTINGYVFPAEPFVKWATSHPTLVQFTNVFRNLIRKSYAETVDKWDFYHMKMKNYVEYATNVLEKLAQSGLVATDLHGTHMKPEEFYIQTQSSDLHFDDNDKLIID